MILSLDLVRYTDGSPVHRGDIVMLDGEPADVLSVSLRFIRGGKETLMVTVRPTVDDVIRTVEASTLGIIQRP